MAAPASAGLATIDSSVAQPSSPSFSKNVRKTSTVDLGSAPTVSQGVPTGAQEGENLNRRHYERNSHETKRNERLVRSPRSVRGATFLSFKKTYAFIG